jgi:hypothetical protein
MVDDKIGLHCGANPRFCNFNTILNSILADNLIFHLMQSPPPRGPELEGRKFNSLTVHVSQPRCKQSSGCDQEKQTNLL